MGSTVAIHQMNRDRPLMIAVHALTTLQALGSRFHVRDLSAQGCDERLLQTRHIAHTSKTI